MAKNFNVILNWRGPFERRSKITECKCMFMVIAAKKGKKGKWIPSSYDVIDIGQSTGKDKENSYYFKLRIACWERNHSKDTTLIYKVAEVSPSDHDEDDRKIIESYLRTFFDSIKCGVENVIEHNPEHRVGILNSGNYKPLEDKYLSPL